MFFEQKTLIFGEKSVKGGSGVPPKSVTPFLPKKLSRKGRGGTPLTDKIRKVVIEGLPILAKEKIFEQPALCWSLLYMIGLEHTNVSSIQRKVNRIQSLIMPCLQSISNQ